MLIPAFAPSEHKDFFAPPSRPIFLYPYVLTEFADADGRFSEVLAPGIARLAADSRFAHVLFLQLGARASPLFNLNTDTGPSSVFAAFREGLLVHCGQVTDAHSLEQIMAQQLAPEVAAVAEPEAVLA